MGFLISWLLADVFYVYLALKLKNKFLRVGISIIVILIEAFLSCFCWLVSIFDMLFWFAFLGILVLLLIPCTLYKTRTISWIEIVAGIVSFVFIGIFLYYFGGICGEFEYSFKDGGGLVRKIPYEIYRWATYLFDVILTWFVFYNLLVSPFWMRSRGYHFLKQLFRYNDKNY